MARTQRLIHLATGVGFVLLSIAGGNANADSSGVTVTVWDNNTGWNQYNQSPPVPPVTDIVGSYTASQIDVNFDVSSPFNLYEDFVVRFQGHITAPITGDVLFYAPADDGAQLLLSGEQVINDWYDKGFSGSVSAPVSMQAGVSQPFTLWFYENGGAAGIQLWWLIDQQWQLVPASAFTISPVATTTTTTTTIPTTTEQPTTTTSTTIQTQTTHHLPTTTSQPVVVQPTSPLTTLPVPVTVSTVPVSVPIDATTTTQPLPTTTLLLPEPTSSAPSTTTPILQLIDTQDINAKQAAALATDPEVIQQATPEQAKEIFDNLEIADLTPEQVTQLIDAVQNAPTEIREAFESEINVFDGAVDSYVPIGSTVPISTRRLVIAAGAMLAAAPMPSAKRK